MTASGLGFAGGGDGDLRAFDVTNGKVWTFQTGRQIAARPTIFTGRKQYIAITVGGTPAILERRSRLAAAGLRDRR